MPYRLRHRKANFRCIFMCYTVSYLRNGYHYWYWLALPTKIKSEKDNRGQRKHSADLGSKTGWNHKNLAYTSKIFWSNTSIRHASQVLYGRTLIHVYIYTSKRQWHVNSHTDTLNQSKIRCSVGDLQCIGLSGCMRGSRGGPLENSNSHSKIPRNRQWPTPPPPHRVEKFSWFTHGLFLELIQYLPYQPGVPRVKSSNLVRRVAMKIVL